MLCGRLADEPPTAVGALHPPKQTKEQEQVARSDALVAEVPLSAAGLSEQRSPSIRSGLGTPVEIRVEVRMVSGSAAVAGEIDDELPHVDALLLDLRVRDARTSVWDRQREHRAVGENRTRTASAA